jgi:outer membrane protein assembly factor BamB
MPHGGPHPRGLHRSTGQTLQSEGKMIMDNYQRGRSSRLPTLLRLLLAFGGVLCLPMTTTAQGPGVQGGEWTFLGGDAWHTRYTPADQINASNFGDLKVAWRFDAASFGPSTSRATPSYVDGRLITVTGERRRVIALDPATGELLCTPWTPRPGGLSRIGANPWTSPVSRSRGASTWSGI